jgi:hypothetical protein
LTSAQPKVGQVGSGVKLTRQNPVRGFRWGCASRAPSAMSLEVAGPPLVRPGAGLLKLCRYFGVDALRPHRLSRSRLIRDLAVIDRLTRELNRLPQRHGNYPCPRDDGSEIVLLFGYHHLRPKRVIVGLTGCHFITNGWTDRSGPSPQATRLVRQLTALTGR